MKNIKIKAILNYDNISFTVIGLVTEKEYKECKDFGLGYVQDGDMMTDVEGFNIHTVLEGERELDAYYLISKGEVGYAEVEVLD